MNDLQKPKYYSNYIRVSANTFDFQFKFYLKTLNEKNKEQVEDLFTVSMSPQHAKAFAVVLNDHLKKYEESFGEICLQPKEEPKQEG